MIDRSSGTIHATCVAIDGYGVLIMGPSGSGKSDLALRLIDRGAALVSDDRCVIESVDPGALSVSPPPTLAGKIEVRGIGIVPIDFAPAARLALVITLERDPPRMPDKDDSVELCGYSLPRLRIDAAEASAPIKVALALRLMTGKMA